MRVSDENRDTAVHIPLVSTIDSPPKPKPTMARAFCSFRRKQQKLVAYVILVILLGLFATRMYNHVTVDVTADAEEDFSARVAYEESLNDYEVKLEVTASDLTANGSFIGNMSDKAGGLAALELKDTAEDSLTDIDNKRAQLSHRVLTLWQLEQKRIKPETSLIEEKDICERYNKEARQVRTNITGVWSKLNYCPADDVTLVTQAHANKVDRIIKLANLWDGPMSIAIYIGNDDILDFTTKIGADDNIMKRQNIDFHLVAESGEFYPINLLRNMALKNAKTAFVLLVDVDFLPSEGLHDYLKGVLETGALQGNKVLVVPVFEYPKETDIQEIPKNKAELIAQLQDGHLKPFHWKWFPTMGPIDYKRWIDEENSYTVEYKDGFEPYIVMERGKVPPYDQNFLGRYGNKNSHLMEVWARGYEFVVLPDCFMIHFPHHIQWKTPYMHCSVRVKQKFVERLKSLYSITKIP